MPGFRAGRRLGVSAPDAARQPSRVRGARRYFVLDRGFDVPRPPATRGDAAGGFIETPILHRVEAELSVRRAWSRPTG